ncbi:hypothetical protein M885DRAFT_336551 [Pelagophyceae sp. CCMP2097]|nr:hypothetical protein M885DRAFT_336551 [Pelagophyceae sp. CCMP2097]
MIRRGFVRYTRMQYRDGLHHFLLSPPRFIDLELVVRVPGTEVLFEQTDYNRHFTVREIVRDSERGFYNLVHQTGLAHLEHYFRVMFFASRINAKFDRELLQGEAYEMRVRVGTIAGPLIDIEVEFVNALGERCFLVTWRLMLVTDATKKQMYDFERGGVFGPPSAAVVEEAPKKSLPQPRAVTFRLWLALGCLLTYIVCYLLFRHEMLSRFARALFAAALDDFWGSVTKTELGFAAAVGALSLGVELGLWTAQTPIHGLLPHG